LPSRKVHEKVSLLLTGRKCSFIHRCMDSPSRILGPKHRILAHSIRDVALISLVSKDPVRNFIAGISHLILDQYAGISGKTKKSKLIRFNRWK